MSTLAKPDQLAQEIEQAARTARSSQELMQLICERLHSGMVKFNWIGFYLLAPGDRPGEQVLVLGPFVGSMTPHTRIPLHQGICGAAASSGQTVVVDDVHSDPRYLACSIETKSEIVAPVFVRGKVAGELDIDSHFHAAFGGDERRLVERCAELVGKFLETHPA